jgi:hypothetical protein
MGKVRFYSSDGETYITVRAEELDVGNKHVFHVKLRKRRNVPFTAKTKVRSKPLSAIQSFENDPQASSKLMAALTDIQSGIENSDYEAVILGTVFKSDELQLSIRLGKSKWKNFQADNFVQALLDYADELESEMNPSPPPTPLKGGKGS